MLGENGEELKILVYALVHAFHVPKIQREILRLCMPCTNLSLQKNEGARLRDDVPTELS